MKYGELYRSADFKNEKHSPVIEVPEKVTAGEFFEITVSVGKEIAHPNTTGHFIAWISLVFKPDGDNYGYDLGKVEFNAHGASIKGADSIVLHTHPFAKFHMKTDRPGTLFATSYCNIHGLWEASARIEI